MWDVKGAVVDQAVELVDGRFIGHAIVSLGANSGSGFWRRVDAVRISDPAAIAEGGENIVQVFSVGCHQGCVDAGRGEGANH